MQTFLRQPMLTLIGVFLFAGYSLPAWPHPVSFKDSVGIMGNHSPSLSHVQLNYSWRYWLATGIHYYKRPDFQENRYASFASVNLLLKRWNTERFQANLYGILGAGHSELNDEPRFIGAATVQFDIEDRKYYFLIKHMQLQSEEGAELNESKVRLGIAPYVEGYDGIHSWLILEYQSWRYLDSSRKEELTPLLRVFYRNLLFEIGQSFEGMTKFNYIAHF